MITGKGTVVFMVVAVVLAAMVGLVGCSVHNDTIGQYREFTFHEHIDGRTIPCVALRTDHGAGISCDWGH